MSRITTWLDRTRIAYLAVALVLAVAGWRLTAAAPDDGTTAGPAPVVEVRAATASPEAAEPPRLVHVTGAVRRPGVYRVRGDARAMDALRRAGGPTRHADLAGLNLAAPVVDGQQLVVPDRRRPAGATAAAGHPSAAPATGPIRLSTATAAELESLDGIGPALAARIVRWREENGAFGAVEDLLEVPGIGETRLEALRDQVVP